MSAPPRSRGRISGRTRSPTRQEPMDEDEQESVDEDEIPLAGLPKKRKLSNGRSKATALGKDKSKATSVPESCKTRPKVETWALIQ